MLPAGAAAIPNPMGTAPAFRVEREDQVVISLPGVPAEMAYLMEAEVLPYLRKSFKLRGVIKARVVRVAGVGESWLDEHIGDLEQLSNPTVGLSAHPGRVDIRITAKAGTDMEAEEMIWGIQATLQQRLKDRIYGVDAETLEAAVLSAVRAKGWRLVVVEAGTDGALGAALASAEAGIGDEGDAAPSTAPSPGIFAGGRLLEEAAGRAELAEAAAAAQKETGAEVALQVLLATGAEQHTLYVAMRSPSGEQSWERSYGGALPNAPYWAVSLALDYLRRQLAA
jgi:nicotinamide-nucleotide amidase